MWSLELNQIKFSVDNIWDSRLNRDSWFGKVSRTRVDQIDIGEFALFNFSNCNSTCTATTTDNDIRNSCVSLTWVSNNDLRNSLSVNKLESLWECNLRLQSKVMSKVKTNINVREVSDLTNSRTKWQNRCTYTCLWNYDGKISTRTRECRSKKTINRWEVNRSSCISNTSISNVNLCNFTSYRLDFGDGVNNSYWFDGNVYKTARSITIDRNVSINAWFVLSTAIIDSNLFDLSWR